MTILLKTKIRYRKVFFIFSTLSIITIISNLILTESASAKYFRPLKGNYIGGGASFQNNNSNQNNGVYIQGRIQISDAPISVRGSASFLEDGNTIFSPTITYDIPILNNINFYIGGGVFLSKETKGILTVGGEVALSKNIVIYGDLNGFGSGNISKLGIGYRF
jgi:hypothetical protein